MTTLKTIIPDLELINKLIFKTCGLNFSNFEPESESQEYSACNFQLNKKNIKFRQAKITAIKTGQFVTIWKRNEKGITQPYDISDDIYFYLIAVRKQNKFGLFIFPKSVLHNNKILSDKTRDGKRGIRVYPSWDRVTSKQAQKTQEWQTRYFLEIPQDKLIDIKRAKHLFEIDS